MSKFHLLTFLAFLCLATSCRLGEPEYSDAIDECAKIYPDYTEVTIPCNIAPLNFDIKNEGDAFRTMITSASGDAVCVSGREVRIKESDWAKIISSSEGKEVTFTIYAKRGGEWYRLNSFINHVAEDPIDEYITYRLLAPSYEFYTAFSIRQRELSSFKEKEVYNNRMHYTPKEQQCMNCHSFRNYRTEDWQMHVRQVLGGTVIIQGDDSRKVNLKTDWTLSSGVFPSWHPSKNIIAYSVCDTRQFYHEKNIHKIEYQDRASDLIIYDIDKNEVRLIASDTLSFETFPSWSPDGKYLYFTSARQPQIAKLPSDSIGICYDQIKYDIVRMSYDQDSGMFGDVEVVVDAQSEGKSAMEPRISPDQKYVLYSLSGYGTFHIWHRDSDIWVKNLESGEQYALKAANSEDADSYHVWSSNGRWIAFTSRRDDGLFTRLYFSYFDKEGNAHKAFSLPMKDYKNTRDNVMSYNYPEFTIEPIRQGVRELSAIIEKEATRASYAE